MINKITTWIDETLYLGFGASWDDEMFRRQILDSLCAGTHLLDIGAGRGAKQQMNFHGLCRFIAGVDPDKAVLKNPYLDEAKVLSPPDYRIGYADDCFDLVVCNCVLEHIHDRDAFFRDVFRVLKPGGRFLAKTPNKYHYVPTLARITPHWFHAFYNRLRGREECDTFPTTYACNTRRDVYDAAHRHGFEVEQLEIVEGRPEYLRLNPLFYLVGILYERTVNRFSFLEPFRCVIMFRMVKNKNECAKEPITAAA